MKQQATLDTKLIENALALTGKTMEDMMEWIHKPNKVWKYIFSIEKFCYYLLSPEFIEKYYKNMYPNEEVYTYSNFFHWCVERFWNAIFQCQDWNEKPLQELLSKIWN